MSIKAKDIANEVFLSGVLSGYKIEKKEVEARWDSNNYKKGEKVEAHNGYFTVQTGENQFATVNVQNRIVSYYNGEMDATSKALEAMAKEELDTYYKTKDLTQTPVISVWGKDKQGHTNLKMVDNYYVNKTTGEVSENFRLELGFAKIALGDPKEEPRFDNEVVLNGYVENIRPELDKATGEETGRAIVTMAIPYVYGSKDNQVIRCLSTNFVAGEVEIEEDGEIEVYNLGGELLDYPDEAISYSWQAVVELNGFYVETEKEVETVDEGRRGFGRKRKTTNTQRTAVRELLLVGLNPLQEAQLFEKEDIDEAKKLRQAEIEVRLKEWEEGQSSQKQESGSGARRGTPFRAGSTTGEAPKTESTATGAQRNRFRR